MFERPIPQRLATLRLLPLTTAILVLTGLAAATTWPGLVATARSQDIVATPPETTVHLGDSATQVAEEDTTATEDESEDDDEWDVNEPFGPHSTIAYTTDEGTWVTVSVSPDGTRLLFDLVGDLYTVPTSGGTATRLTHGLAWDFQPKWSPDGNEILFTSDRGGTDNIWIANADGSDAKAFTEQKDKVTNCGAWSPDGDYIVAKRRLTDQSSLGTTELWLYHRTGGDGIQVTKKDDIPEVSEPTFGPEGRYIYFSARPSRFNYNRDVNDGIYQIRRYDRVTGEVTRITSRFGGAGRPTISPDGTQLAYVTRDRAQTVLVIHNLESGAERVISKELSRDLQESFAWAGVYPAMSWTPDGNHLALWAKGKLGTISVADGTWKEISFSADVEQTVVDAVRFKPDVTGDELRLRILRWAQTSPTDQKILFSAIGRLYVTEPDGTNPRVLLRDDDDTNFEYAPRYSPDGKSIAYVNWNDQDKGHVFRARANGSGIRQLTTVPGQYVNPNWSPDGKSIVYLRGSGATLRENDIGEELWHQIYIIDNDGKNPRYVTSVASRGSARPMPSPTFGPKGERIYFNEDGGPKDLNFVSVALNGTDKRHHVTVPYGEEVALSPDGKWIIYKHLHDAYVAPFPLAGTNPIEMGSSSGPVKVADLTKEGADFVHWIDNETMGWVSGPLYYAQTIEKAFADPPEEEEEEENDTDDDEEDDAEEEDPNAPAETAIDLTVPRHRPNGVLVLDGARLVTMKGDEIIENGRIVIHDNRISEMGAAGSVAIPDGAEVRDVSGMTVTPGFVDAHAHMGYNAMDVFPRQDWQYYANLAYGVTTTMDPSASTQLVFGQSEMVESGLMKGPRVYSTGFILYGADIPGKSPTSSVDDARNHIRRMKRRGAFAVKSYMQPRREQRQWYIKAALEEEMLVFPEGGGNFEMNMGMIVDGHTGIEHSVPVAPLYDDIVQLWSQTQVGYTPTLVVAYGGLSGEHYFYQNHGPVWANEKLLRFTPRAVLDSRSRRLPVMAHDDDWYHIMVSESCTKVFEAGGSVQLGAHGQLQGLGAHWELWAIGQGGMSNHDALKCATFQGAWYIGLGDELGSLEPGKLADIAVFADNPLDDLQNTSSIRYVVKNGELFDADTMDQLWPEQVPRPPFLWIGDGGGPGD